jgi:gliding motility-associated-like protein
MFEEAEAFDQEIASWDVSVVTNFNSMFKNTPVFNRPLNTWNTGEALNMAEMFSGALAFNQNIDGWNVSFVTTMQDMFKGAARFDQSLNSWNVASVTTMEGMFENASAFNSNIGDWNVRGVNTMQDMFNGASSFNQSINDWRINGVSTMEGMFQNAIAFNQSFESWIPGTVSMLDMFSGASAFDQYLGDWNIENVTNMQRMLDNTVLSRENYDNTLIAWSEQNLTPGITFGASGLPYCDALQERQSMIDTFGWTILGDVLDCPIPECTQLVSPINGATDVPVNTNLTWDNALYAESYDLTITILPSNTVITETVTETSYQFADGVLTLGDSVSVLITPVNGEGNAVGCITEIFTIASTPPTFPECTSLSLPLGGATDVPIDTDLEWNPVSNADSYIINVTTSDGTVIVNNENVGNVTSYEFGNSLPEDTVVNVTIVTSNEVGDAVGCTEESFTTELIPVPPSCTALTSPVDGTINVPIDTDISWNTVDGATGYLVVVGTTQGGIDVVNNIEVEDGTTYSFGADLQENRTHYVTIIPYNDVGDALGCTEESFRTGNSTLNDPPACTTLSNALNGAVDVAVDLAEISWNAAANADGYRINIDGSTSDLNDEADLVVMGTSHPFANTFDNGETVTVTIVPFNANGDATGCVSESFTIIAPTPTPPNCTTLIAPGDGAVDVAVDLAEISWNAAANADGYRITIDGSTSELNDVTDLVVTGTSHPFTNDFENGETVTVTIVPFNANGDATGCTSESFTIEMENPELPECTNLTSPLNLDIDVPVDTTFSWDAAPGAEGYRLTVGTAAGLGDIFSGNVGNVTTFDLPDDLPENTEIFVLVQPFNAVGDAEFCEEESFITGMTPADLPLCTTLSNPENGSIDVAVNTDISWRAVGDIDGYLLNVGTTAGGSDIFSEDVGLTTSHTLAQDLPFGQEIFVTIIPYNESAQAENCESQSFTTVEEIEEVESLFGFSPDGDGNNDFWTINGIEEYPNNSVMIFNRWGDMVFKIDGYDNNSNVFRGEANQLTGMGAGQLPEGTYFFQINVPEAHNLKTTQGYLVLKR